jgi:catecholate siderophore receptor
MPSSVLPLLLVLTLFVATATADVPSGADLRGRVLDTDGGAIVGAAVTLRDLQTADERHATTDARGEFAFARLAPGRYLLVALAAGFAATAIDVETASELVTLTLDPAPVSEQITVSARMPEAALVIAAAKIAVSPMDLPQAADSVPHTLLQAQAARSMQDALRNVAGVTPNLGEGRRDQFLIRGFSAQSDTLADGIRDDALYYRDLATIDRVEVLKGPASALFGRGSSGGVINRVTKKARFDRAIADLAVIAGGFGTKRLTFDAGRPSGNRRLAYRLAGAWEDSGSFRDFASLSRVALAPSVSAFLSPSTSITAQLDYLHDRRIPDRGIPSLDGTPAQVRIAQYYGDPHDDFLRTDVLAATFGVEHHLAGRWVLRNLTRTARYGTTWSNTQPTGARTTAAGPVVTRSQYNADQTQQNLFNQTEAVGTVRFARATHTLLAGVEAGVQHRQVVRFNGTAANVALIDPVLTRPVYSSVAASDNNFAGRVFGVYAQDLVAIGSHWKALVGLRGDRYGQQLDDRRPRGVDLGRVDRSWSPRAGLVYQPSGHVSVYANLSRSFQPSGEGLSLAVNTAELEPESTRNVEGGIKVLVGGRASATASVFRLDRTNIKTTDPIDPTRLVLVGRQRTDGIELSLDGAMTRRVAMRASYAGYAAAILRSNSVLSGVRIEGNRPGLVPRHSGALWGTVAVTPRLTVGAGVTAAGERFTSNDSLVRMGSLARADAVASYRVGPFDISLNLHNLFDSRYFESASGNFQIYPGAPRHALVTVRYTFR